MDLVFPVFVPASDSVVERPVARKKSLWELVIEDPPDQSHSRSFDASSPYGAHTSQGEGPSHTSGTGGSYSEDDISAAVAATSRSSWRPTTYMVKNLLSSGFASQFCTLNAIECSAKVPPPPCMRMEDIQLPPFVLKRLREQMALSLSETVLAGGALVQCGASHRSEEPYLRELQQIVLNGAVEGEGERGCEDDARCGEVGTPVNEELEESEEGAELFLTALQQLTLTSMLLGNHTVTVAPHGTGKKTAGLIAMAALTLARECDMSREPAESPQEEGMNGEKQNAQALPPLAPRAVMLVSSFRELQQCNRWLQHVFTSEAFVPLTFRRGTSQLEKLPIFFPSSSGICDVGLPNYPAGPVGSPALRKEGQWAELEKRTDPMNEAIEQSVELHSPEHKGVKRKRDLSEDDNHHRSRRSRSRRHRRSRRHHRRSRSPSKHKGDRRTHKHRSLSPSNSRHRRRSRSTGREREGSGRWRRRSRVGRSSSRRRRGSRPRARRHSSTPRSSCPKVACGTREIGKRKEGDDLTEPLTLEQHLLVTPEPLEVAVERHTREENVEVGEVPRCLQLRVPILLATHQSFADALQEVQGQAELLPLECVRVVCVADADRVAQQNSQVALLPSWWISFSNAVDVDCQFIVSASRMFDEVNTWLRETVLQGTPHVVNWYRQRDDTVWLGVQHIIDVVHVAEPTEYGRPKHHYEGVEGAKLARLADIVTQHFTSPLGATAAEETVGDDVAASAAGSASTLVGRVVVMVSSRKEQEVVFSHLVSSLQSCVEHVKCVCRWEDFRHGNADLLVAYDWMVTISSNDDRGDMRRLCPTTLVVNYSFPRLFFAPGKEEALLECLVIRTRTLLCGYSSAGGGGQRKGKESGAFGRHGRACEVPLTVLTLLTKRQVEGRLGCLLQQRAHALTAE